MTGQNKKNPHSKNVLIYGGTGQAKVIEPILDQRGFAIRVVIDETPKLKSPYKDIPIVTTLSQYENWLKKTKIKIDSFLVCIGNPHAKERISISQKLIKKGLNPLSAIHPTAIIETIKTGKGLQILANTYVAAKAQIGDYCILNAGSQLDHDSILEEGVELGPKAIVCGECHIGANTWIGAGAIIKDHIKIGRNVIIGAGTVVVKDIPDNTVYVGNPARFLKRNK
jgi:sugar O-acyltransferase (sialic acid O-acetyltransferase NeuD family)